MTKNRMWKMVCSGLIGLLINLPGVVCSQESGMTMYVTRGLGLEGKAASRVRFLCPPEIILWEISGRVS